MRDQNLCNCGWYVVAIVIFAGGFSTRMNNNEKAK
jgi:hypothetical protein